MPPVLLPADSPVAARARRRFWVAWLLSCAVLLALGAAAIGAAYWFMKGPVQASGGAYFLRRVELPVPQFFQADPRWSEEDLGETDDTLGSAGCAVASTAMVLKFYGQDTDPARLNAALRQNGGYTEQGWLQWEKAAETTAGKVRHVYEDDPSYYLIDSNLWRGNPVIVRLRYPNKVTHFVVVCGKDGFDYLVRDPGAGGAKGVYPLREFGSAVEALRYYEKL